MTLLTAGALTDPRLPATASNVCTTDAKLGGVGRVPPPQTKILATPLPHDCGMVDTYAIMIQHRSTNCLMISYISR